MSATRERTDVATLGDRLRYLLALRVGIAVVTVVFSVAGGAALAIRLDGLLWASVGYLVLSLAFEWLSWRQPRVTFTALTVMLLVDGLYLALAMYATGGTQSPMRFLVYLHLVAVSLLASYRTGLKIALWHSLLLFVVLYAQAASLVPAVDVQPGVTLEFERMPVLSVTAFWLFALATSLFSAMNEKELRQRRADLEALVELGAHLDDEGDPVRQARLTIDALVSRYGFPRVVLFGMSDDRLIALATHGVDEPPTSSLPPEAIATRAWELRAPFAIRRLDPRVDAELARVLPDARNLVVAPMLADGRPLGLIVLEHHARSVLGVERRVVSVVAQAAVIAALNLRNAVLLKNVQDLAERDALTGAANRRSFQTSLERVLDPATRSANRISAVMFIDLDDFKVVNDTLGHAAGDALLVGVTERIASLVRSDDLVARLGGDEFAILTEDHPDLRRSLAMADRLVRELRAPYLIGDQRVVVTTSIGIASARDAMGDAAEMVRNADVAMYMAKANGKAGYAVFDPGMHTAIRDRHEMAIELQQAVELDQLELRYQPIVELKTGVLSGVEALVRWRHPEKGLIAPGQFIEIAEEHGSILPIGRWVLGEACRQAAAWRRAGAVPADMFVAVNVSAREIQEHDFVEGVRHALRDNDVDPTSLVLEITETALLRATPLTIATLVTLRELGIRIYIDDFGTGYFSLSHLRQFPVDALKIATEFTQDAKATSRTSGLAAAIVAMAHSLGIDTVAEGIETSQQARLMRTIECRYGQGFFFAHPLLAAELVESTAAAREATLAADGPPAGVKPRVRRPRSTAPRRSPQTPLAADPG